MSTSFASEWISFLNTCFWWKEMEPKSPGQFLSLCSYRNDHLPSAHSIPSICLGFLISGSAAWPICTSSSWCTFQSCGHCKGSWETPRKAGQPSWQYASSGGIRSFRSKSLLLWSLLKPWTQRFHQKPGSNVLGWSKKMSHILLVKTSDRKVTVYTW